MPRPGVVLANHGVSHGPTSRRMGPSLQRKGPMGLPGGLRPVREPSGGCLLPVLSVNARMRSRVANQGRSSLRPKCRCSSKSVHPCGRRATVAGLRRFRKMNAATFSQAIEIGYRLFIGAFVALFTNCPTENPKSPFRSTFRFCGLSGFSRKRSHDISKSGAGADCIGHNCSPRS